MPYLPKTGAVGIHTAVKRISIITQKYRTKLLALIADAQTDGAITAEEAAELTAFVVTVPNARTLWDKLATYYSLKRG
jgi:hypothetical protein